MWYVFKYPLLIMAVVLVALVLVLTLLPQREISGQAQYRIMLLTGGGMWASTTSGSASNTQIELGTNDVDVFVLDFDASTDESAQCTVALPPSYRNNSPVYATIYWTSTSSTTSDTVFWDIAAQSYSNDDPLDASWGSAVSVNDDVLAANDCHITAETSALTIGNSPSRGDLVQFKITRDADNGSDDLSVDARLLMVKIRFAGD